LKALLVGFIYFFFITNLSIAQDTTLSLNAVFDQPEYRVGQPVKLTVIITNNSSNTVYVRWSSATLLVESGGASLFKRKGMPGAWDEKKKLKPGDFWSKESEYLSEFYNMPAAGDYQVTIAYKNDKEVDIPDVGGRRKIRFHELWRGEVKASAALKIID
jgi:hypothetical protein